MEVTKDLYDKVHEYMTFFVKNKTLELEGKYKDYVTKELFSRGLEYFMKLGLKHVDHPETLDIFTVANNVQYRISLKGKETISEYCRRNVISAGSEENIDIMTKNVLHGMKSIFMTDYGFKVDLRNEIPIKSQKGDEVLLQLPLLDKGFRYKKRFSFEDNDKNVRYDFSIVKTSLGKTFISHKNFLESSVTSAKETYEIEVECLRKHGKDIDKLTSEFLRSMISLYSVIHGDRVMISKKEKVDVVQGYLNLCFSSGQQAPKKKNKNASVLDDAFSNPKSYFFGPQPITLEKKNMIKSDLGVTTIKEGYTVTEKADGERSLLYVNGQGKCYLIDNRLNIKFIGTRLTNFTNSIFDGEYIVKDILGQDVSAFGIFDAYFVNGVDVRGLPLIGTGKSRHLHMLDFIKKCAAKFSENNYKVFVKDILDNANIFEAAKTILDKSKNGGYMYHIDGLIFTPKILGVGCDFEGDAPNNFGTWTKVLKWKPPSENTIDFLVKYARDTNGKSYYAVKDNQQFRRMDLYVGYNPIKWEAIKPYEYLMGNIKRNDSYYARKFLPPDALTEDFATYDGLVASDDQLPVCTNGDAIEDNSIVEFAWTGTAWSPLRVRKDKTEALRRNGLSNTANDFSTALNVWRSILEPVTYEHITGKIEIKKENIKDYDVYYSRNGLRREKFASRPMMDFHNWVKNTQVINREKEKPAKSIMDLACGKAGDLPKWIEGGYKKVLGLDVKRDNIENSTDGAYARTHDNFRRPKDMEYVYLAMDCSKKLDEDYINGIEDLQENHLAKVLFGYIDKANIREDALKKYYRYANDKFDVVSCQFAIHYFFESEETLDNFIDNVDRFLSESGYFVGTCLDGHKIKAMLKDQKKGGEVRGVKNNRVLWNIKKLYTANIRLSLGEEIEIYMESIGSRLKEYIVNMDVLVKKLKKRNIHLVKLGSFEEAFAQYGNQDAISEEEKRYSFLNQYFIFKKGK